jgi:hypothetical protein
MLPEYGLGILKFKHQDRRTRLFKKKDLQLTHRLHKRKITARECCPASKIYSSDGSSPRRFRYLVPTQNMPDHGVGSKTDVANYSVAICDHRPERVLKWDMLGCRCRNQGRHPKIYELGRGISVLNVLQLDKKARIYVMSQTTVPPQGPYEAHRIRRIFTAKTL